MSWKPLFLLFKIKTDIFTRTYIVQIKVSVHLAPPAGLEPATSWLTVTRSTDWAKEEYKNGKQNLFPVCHNRNSVACQHRPILPDRRRSSIVGVIELNCRVRNGNGWTLNTNDTDYLVHLQGFEPGTHWLRVSCSTNWAKGAFPGFPYAVPSKLNKTRILYSFCSSPRSISISQLNALPHLHLWPIKLVVFKWPY